MSKCACGAELGPGIRFCSQCGKPVSQENTRQIQDAVINRSNIGQASVGNIIVDIGGKPEKQKSCPVCENLISERNLMLLCEECNSKFCMYCEQSFRRGIARRIGEAVLCRQCHKDYQKQADLRSKQSQVMKNLKPKTNMEAMKIQTANIPDSGAFLEAIDAIFLEVQRDGTPSIDIISGELHRKVGGYPGPNHRMPVLCGIMKRIMLPGDKIISEPPSGSGATLRIRYQLPRGQC